MARAASQTPAQQAAQRPGNFLTTLNLLNFKDWAYTSEAVPACSMALPDNEVPKSFDFCKKFPSALPKYSFAFQVEFQDIAQED